MNRTFLLSLCGALLFASLLPATTIYGVRVDTSTLTGQTGDLYFQFNPGNTDAQDAIASISGFGTNGVLGGPAWCVGTFSACDGLPADFWLGNSAGQNALDQPLMFGSFVSFLVTLSGDAVNAPNSTSTSGTTFSFSVYDAAGQYRLTNDPGEAVLGIAVNPGGILSSTTYPNEDGGASAADISTIPEPASLLLLGAGLAALGLVRLRRK